MLNDKDELANALIAKKKKKKFKDEQGREWDLSDFDETKSWSRNKKIKR